MNEMELPDPLLVMALPIESQGLFARAGIPVLYTGIGKINATYVLTRKLAEYRHAGRPLPLVVNFGTTGSHCFDTGTVVACHQFIQRDMDVTGMGFELGVTPFDTLPSTLEFPNVFPALPSVKCGSGDGFVTTGLAAQCEVIDMEAYALAKVCRLEGALFACAKYVTDGANHSAANDWHSNLPRAAEAFLALYDDVRGLPRTP
ncbi:MAG TPA: 5'-nucleosidase [Steroidobacteraceae bacterium]|jgi:adenosylhomocysteine nucleosidase